MDETLKEEIALCIKLIRTSKYLVLAPIDVLTGG